MVQGAFLEPGQDRGLVARELDGELKHMRQWLELDSIDVSEGRWSGPRVFLV
jgi:hypothetical protein